MLLTASVGALVPELVTGDLVLVDAVLDAQAAGAGRPPAARAGTAAFLLDRLTALGLPVCRYAAVPGPQYETPSEVAFLRHLGGHVAGMSVAAEVEAVAEEGLAVAVLAVVTNAAGAKAPAGGVAPGDALHDEVVAVAQTSLPRVQAVLDALLAGP